MLNLSEIKYHINSVEKTRQITSAMELISISKMKKATQKYENNLTYFKKVRHTIKDILQHSPDGITHKYLNHRAGKRTVYVVIASDKGMAGDYNHNVLNMAWKHMQNVETKYVFTIGQMAREFFAKNGQTIDMEYMHTIQNPTLDDARNITENIIEMYDNDLFDEVLVCFTREFSTAKQEPMIIKLLPVETKDFDDVFVDSDYSGQISYEPSRSNVLNLLVPQYIVGTLYGTLVQSVASEHLKRMIAMSNATKNANEMLDGLKVDYNKARQEKITGELSEIIAGANMR